MAQENFIRRYLMKAGKMGHNGFQIGQTSTENPHELMLNCEKLERDNDECVDICIAKNGMITSGQLGEKYAAQIEIPARQYIEKEVPNPDYDSEVENSSETIMERTPVPFNMANVTLKLYAIE